MLFFDKQKTQRPEERFRFLAYLGQGNTGKCYLALDRTDNTQKVIKHITCTELLNHISGYSKLLTDISHNNIVRTYEILKIDGQWCIVQEYVKGLSLDRYIENYPLTVETICRISKGVLSALSYFESANLAHRDIKPSNIIYNPETRQVTLVDVDYIALSNSNTDNFYGTILYAAPEYLFANNPSACSDIFSYGITLSHLIVGDVPFYLDFKSRIEAISRITSWVLEKSQLDPLIVGKFRQFMDGLLVYNHAFRLNTAAAYELIDEIEHIAKKHNQFDSIVRDICTLHYTYPNSLKSLIPTVESTVLDIPILTHVLERSVSALQPNNLEALLEEKLLKKLSDLHPVETPKTSTDNASNVKYITQLDKECERIRKQSQTTFNIWVASLILIFVTAGLSIILMAFGKYPEAIGTFVLDIFVACFSRLFIVYQNDIRSQQESMFNHLKNMQILEQGEKQTAKITDENIRNQTAADVIKTMTSFATKSDLVEEGIQIPPTCLTIGI